MRRRMFSGCHFTHKSVVLSKENVAKGNGMLEKNLFVTCAGLVSPTVWQIYRTSRQSCRLFCWRKTLNTILACRHVNSLDHLLSTKFVQ